VPDDQASRAVHGVAEVFDWYFDEAATNAEAARRGLDVEQAELGHRVRGADQEDATDHLAVLLGDPAALLGGAQVADVVGHDLGGQGLELLVVAPLLRIQGPLPVDDPSKVAGVRGAQHV
jgi:hypothetical protein